MRSCFLFVYSGLLLTIGGIGLTYVGDPGASNSLQLGAVGTDVFGFALVDSQTYLFTLHITGTNTGVNMSFDLYVNDDLTTPALSIAGKTFTGFDGVKLQTAMAPEAIPPRSMKSVSALRSAMSRRFQNHPPGSISPSLEFSAL